MYPFIILFYILYDKFFKYFSWILHLLDIDKCNESDCLWRPYLLLLAYNIVPVLIGSTLVAYVEVSMFKINISIFIIIYNSG